MAEKPESLPPLDELRMLRRGAADWRLSRGDVAVYSVLLSHADGNLFTFVGPSTMAFLANLSLTNVKKSLARLETLGYVRVHRRGLRKANHYFLQPPPAVPPRGESGNASVPRPRARPMLGESSDWPRRDTQMAQLQSAPSGDAGVRDLGTPAITNWVCGRDSNSLFNSPKNSQGEISDLERSEQQQRQREEYKRRQLETLAAEYLEIRESHPKRAASMMTLFPGLSGAVAALQCQHLDPQEPIDA